MGPARRSPVTAGPRTPDQARPGGSHDRAGSSAEIAAYWDGHIHDLAITTEPIGSAAFFRQLEEYRFEKLHYLPRLVDFDGFAGQRVLEIGCGVGLDLARFVAGGARVLGVDLSPRALLLAQHYLNQRGLAAALQIMDGGRLGLASATVDVVYAHGVIQYAADPASLIAESYRVLRPGGLAILMVYNRWSWLNFLSRIMKVELEHQDAPVLRLYSARGLRRLLSDFSHVTLIPERFPVATRLHRGWKAAVYNGIFVGAFNWLPAPLVRPLGWHLMAFARK